MKKLSVLVLFTSCSFLAMNPLVIPEVEHLTEEVVDDVVQYEGTHSSKTTQTTSVVDYDQKSPLTPAQIIVVPPVKSAGATGPSSPVDGKNAP